jgi:hypothetical protein
VIQGIRVELNETAQKVSNRSQDGALRRVVGWARSQRFLYVLLVLLCVYGWAISRYAGRFEHKVSALICMGDHFCPPEKLPAGTFIFRNGVGYDGEFFYFMARDPFMNRGWSAHVDAPSYRYQRILYPLLVWAFSLGQPALIPLMLVLVNLGAVAAGTWFVARMLRHGGMSEWYSLFYAFQSGFLLAVFRDLCEPVALALAVGCLFFYGRGKWGWAAVFLSLAILARETMAVLIPLLVLDGLCFKREPRKALLLLAPLAPFALWQLFVSLRLGTPTWVEGQRNFGVPLAALIAHVKEVFFAGSGRPAAEKVYLAVFLSVAAMTPVFAVREIVRRRDEISLGLFGFSLMPFLMTQHVWVEPWSYGRVLVPGAVFLVLAFVRSKDRAYLLPLGLLSALFPVVLLWQL